MTPTSPIESVIELVKGEAEHLDPTARHVLARHLLCLVGPWIQGSHVLVVADKPIATSRTELAPMTDRESLDYERTKLGFGEHGKKLIRDVPLDYLAWLADESRRTWMLLHRYLNAPRIRLQRRSSHF